MRMMTNDDSSDGESEEERADGSDEEQPVTETVSKVPGESPFSRSSSRGANNRRQSPYFRQVDEVLTGFFIRTSIKKAKLMQRLKSISVYQQSTQRHPRKTLCALRCLEKPWHNFIIELV